MTKETVNGRKEKSLISFCITGKISPTAKLPLQLTRVATEMAADLGAWVNSSPVINHGIEPGPKAKNVTRLKAAMTVKIPEPLIVALSSPGLAGFSSDPMFKEMVIKIEQMIMPIIPA